jgi:RNA polymerase sigma-70 factor (sigma-E family)
VRDRGSEFDDFVVGMSPRLLRAAIVLTGDRAAAEDLLQDVFERVYVAWPRIDDPLAYARRALVNAANGRWRSRSRRPEVALSAAYDVSSEGRDSLAERDALLRAIAQLPPRQRAVVVLRYLEDMTEADTAATLSCSSGTVKSQASRALATLRGLLGAELGADVPDRLGRSATS